MQLTAPLLPHGGGTQLTRKTVSVQVGHAGTLDPMATGLLIVCVGKATKMVDSFMAQARSPSLLPPPV